MFRAFISMSQPTSRYTHIRAQLTSREPKPARGQLHVRYILHNAASFTLRTYFTRVKLAATTVLKA